MSDAPACALCGGATQPLYDAAPDYLTGQTFAVRRCAGCGVAATAQPADLDAYYPAFYRSFSPVVFHVLRELYTWKVGAWVRRFGTQGRALEVGCGSGWMLSALRERGWEVVGSERTFAVAESVHRSHGIPMFVGDTGALRDDRPFDLIVLFQVLEHMRDPAAVLAACARLLKPGGAMVIAVPNAASWQARATGPEWQHLDVPRHLFHFDLPGLTRAVRAVGLEVQEVSHVSWEHDPFGWLQSALNRLGFPQNRLIQWLQGQDRATVFTPSGLLMLLLIALLAVPSVLLAVLSWQCGQGALMEVTVRRPPLPEPPAAPAAARPRRALYAVALALAWLAYASLFYDKGLPNPDSGYVFQHGREIYSGKLMYRDIVPHIPPVTPLLQAGWMHLLGQKLIASRVHFVVSYGLILVLAYLCLTTAFPCGWALAFSLASMTMCGALLPSFSWYNYDATITFLAGAYLLLADSSAALAGLLFGLCILTKTNFGAIAAVSGFLHVLAERPRRMPAYLAGLLLPLGLFATWLVTYSDVAAFKMLVVTGQVDSKGGASLPLNLLLPLVSRTGVLAPLVFLATVLAVVGTGARAWVAAAALFAMAVAAWAPLVPYIYGFYAYQCAAYVLLFIALAAVLRRGGRVTSRYLWLVFYSGGLLASDSFSQLAPWIHNACSFLSLPVLFGSLFVLEDGGLVRVRRPALAALVALVAAIGAHSRFARPYHEQPLWTHTYAMQAPGLQGIHVEPTIGREIDGLLATISRETADEPTGGLLVYPEGPAFYVGTGKLCPLRLLNVAPTFSQSIGRYFQDGEIARLAAHPPRMMLFVKEYDITQPPVPYRPELLLTRNRFPLLSRWIADHYRLVEDAPHLTLFRYAP